MQRKGIKCEGERDVQRKEQGRQVTVDAVRKGAPTERVLTSRETSRNPRPHRPALNGLRAA